MNEIKYVSLAVKIKIPNAFSKKDKRKVIKSLMKKLQNKFNVSIAEVEEMETNNLAILGMIIVGNDYSYLDSVTQKIVNQLDVNHRIEVLEVKKNFNKEGFYDL